MGHDLEEARRALDAGDVDQALVLLWKALEPARLEGDEAALEEIAALARRIPRREAADLLQATGVEPAQPVEAEQPPPQAPTRSRLASLLWILVLLVLMAMIGLAYSRGGAEIEQPQPAKGIATRIPIDADGLFLVPLARYPQSELTDVGLSVIAQVGAVDIRTSIPLGPTTYDAERGQFVAEELLRRLTESYSIEPDRKALVVGVTSLDMYERAEPGKASVAIARTADGRYAVISTHGLPVEPDARDAALRQILLGEIRRADLKRTL